MKEKGIIEIHEENVSVLKKDVQITDLIVNKKDIARLKEELVLPANKANIYQILWTQVDMENLQAKIGEHMIEIQGAMHIFVLYLGEDAQMPVQYARWEIPVDTQLECYECMPGMIGRIGMTLGGQQLEIRLMRMEKKELFLWMLRSTVILKSMKIIRFRILMTGIVWKKR